MPVVAAVAVVGALVLGTLLSACAAPGSGSGSGEASPAASPSESESLTWTEGEDLYSTHCGVGQQEFDGVVWYPTGVYEGGTELAGDDYAGPTPWVLDEAQWGLPQPGPTFTNEHMLVTRGTFDQVDDDSAVFHVYGGRWTIELTTTEADAAWIIEGCA
ncbi:hypothetical protein [Demequina silvatica]|uniref:hypothetical protein n=1 Tax=Demequina silvatica TaxID=1638988 RepID=UPI0007826411|nr:hypothetical protein [Demequina silvatica]